MDVNIDTEAVVGGINSIAEVIEQLQDIVSFMSYKLDAAGEEFTSINFERASLNVNLANQSLNNVNDNLKVTKDYLNKLVDYILEYNKIKY